MPNLTPILGLPYPAPSDRPCNFDEQWCDFTNAVEGFLDGFDAAIARTIPTVPAVILRQTEQRTLQSNVDIPFDSVLLDTGGMSDLEADPYVVRIPRTGVYTIQAWSEQQTSGNVNATLEIFVTYPMGGTFAQILDRGGTMRYQISAFNPAVFLPAGAVVRLEQDFVPDFGATRIIYRSQLSVVWHADTEVP